MSALRLLIMAAQLCNLAALIYMFVQGYHSPAFYGVVVATFCLIGAFLLTA